MMKEKGPNSGKRPRRNAQRSGVRSTYAATFVKRQRWWVPGALTQGRTLAEAKENLRDAIRLMLVPVSTEAVAGGTVVVRERISI
jgi:hypothetical protein